MREVVTNYEDQLSSLNKQLDELKQEPASRL